MQIVTLDGLDLGELADAVGARTYERGALLAHRGAVRHLEWDDSDTALWALVQGETDEYETVVYLESAGRERLVYTFGECSCPVGVECKHVVAVMVTATGGTRGTGRTDGAAWERDLDALIGPGHQADAGDDGHGVPLAVELSLSLPAAGSAPRHLVPAAPRLLARLVRPGRSGWVGGNLSWSRLEAPWALGEHRAAHLRLLRELYVLHRSDLRHRGYHPRDDKTIDLAACESRRLWALLDEAADLGVQLVHPRKDLGVVERIRGAEVRLDVTAGTEPGSLAIEPVLHADAVADPVPVLFVGSQGHGVVCASAGQRAGRPDPTHWRLWLAETSAAVPPPVQRMVREGARLPVPPGQQDRFAREFYPKLRRLAPVESSDGAFVPPAISDPTLVLRAAFGDGHDAVLAWEWAYEVAGTPVRAPLAPAGDDEAYRDPAREKALLERLDVPLDGLGISRTGHAPGRRLTGMDTMRFATEVLPLLADAPDVRVETTGEPADYREAGDSLRIGVSTGAVSGETDWFDLGVTVTVEGTEVPFAIVFGALAAGEEHLLLADGAWFSLLKPELQALRALIEEARELQDRPGAGLRISRFQAGLWEELAALGVVDRQAEAWRQQVGALLELEGLGDTPLPDGLTAELRPYQRDGFGWLAFLWRHRLGGILADDMGLGKTLQTLALISHAAQADPDLPPFLIVAPTSVVATWASEAARFAPGLSVVTLTDTLRRRGQRLDEATAGADVVVTSYTLFRIDAEAHAAARWSGLVLDEAQFAKNHQSKVHRCARMLPAPFKLAITGTPMENNLMELWSLLSITAPGLFPHPTRFKETYVRPIERRNDAELLSRLRRRVRPLIRRRTKEQVAADLPHKQVQRLEVELDPAHRRIYQRHLQRERQKVLGLIADVDRNRFTILQSLTLLRQLSLHPGLIDPEHSGAASSKIDALVEQLTDVISGGHRALVFSQFTGFLAQVRARLEAEGVPYAYLDGSTRDRPAVVRGFTEGTAPVFLISLKAGGFGLNLTEADYCFLLDPWWNPATEAQAIDRTHRIGQTRNVMVYRMIARDTVEEKVAALADRKAELFRGVMDDGGAFGSALDAEDIRALLE